MYRNSGAFSDLKGEGFSPKFLDSHDFSVMLTPNSLTVENQPAFVLAKAASWGGRVGTEVGLAAAKLLGGLLPCCCQRGRARRANTTLLYLTLTHTVADLHYIYILLLMLQGWLHNCATGTAHTEIQNIYFQLAFKILLPICASPSGS